MAKKPPPSFQTKIKKQQATRPPKTQPVPDEVETGLPPDTMAEELPEQRDRRREGQ